MTEPLTIVICFDHAAVTGGQAKVAFDSAVGLKRQGHRPIVFAAAGPVSPLLAENGIETICLDQKGPDRQPFEDRRRDPGRVERDRGECARGPARQPAARAHDRPRARLGQGAVAVDRRPDRALRPAGRLHDPRIFPVLSKRRLLQLPAPPRLQAEAAVGRVLDDELRFPRYRPAARCGATCASPRPSTSPTCRTCFPTTSRSPISSTTSSRRCCRTAARLHRVDNPVSVPILGPKADPAAGDIIFVGRLSPEKGAFVFAEAARKAGIRPTYRRRRPDRRRDRPALPGGPHARLARCPRASRRRCGRRARWCSRRSGTRASRSPCSKPRGSACRSSSAMPAPGREEVEDGVTGLWFKSADIGRSRPRPRTRCATTRDGRRRCRTPPHAAYWRRPADDASAMSSRLGALRTARCSRARRGALALFRGNGRLRA